MEGLFRLATASANLSELLFCTFHPVKYAQSRGIPETATVAPTFWLPVCPNPQDIYPACHKWRETSSVAVEGEGLFLII